MAVKIFYRQLLLLLKKILPDSDGGILGNGNHQPGLNIKEKRTDQIHSPQAQANQQQTPAIAFSHVIIHHNAVDSGAGNTDGSGSQGKKNHQGQQPGFIS
ncbi:hypothetical protein SDC9_191414 [bioreactor metagenome]|uniref:Uncharacterized protein n=1 Tax=bioreactor metagenome TaxID=1076179 RepID=A0A645I8W6_9ZZZZ